MKTLTAASIILSLTLSGSAYAVNSNDTDPYVYLASKTETGSVYQGSSLPTASSNFWNENSALLERHSNEVDSNNIAVYEAARTGSQPEVGSLTLTNRLLAGNSDFWAQNGALLIRSNPLR